MFPAEMRIDFPSGHGSLINAPTSCSDNGPVAIRATALSRNRASGSSAPHLFASFFYIRLSPEMQEKNEAEAGDLVLGV